MFLVESKVELVYTHAIAIKHWSLQLFFDYCTWILTGKICILASNPNLFLRDQAPSCWSTETRTKLRWIFLLKTRSFSCKAPGILPGVQTSDISLEQNHWSSRSFLAKTYVKTHGEHDVPKLATSEPVEVLRCSRRWRLGISTHQKWRFPTNVGIRLYPSFWGL